MARVTRDREDKETRAAVAGTIIYHGTGTDKLSWTLQCETKAAPQPLRGKFFNVVNAAMGRMLYLRVSDSLDSPFHQHERKELSHPRHYSDFLAERNDLCWLPRSPHSVRPQDIWSNLRCAFKAHDCWVSVAPSLFVLFARGAGLVRTPYFLVFWGNGSRSRIRRLIVRANLVLADRIIVNDTGTRDELVAKWRISPSKVKWLPLPVDTDYYHPAIAPKNDYLLVPGDTKRDEPFVLSAAENLPWTMVRSVKHCPQLARYEDHPAVKAGRLVIRKWAAFSEILANTQHARAVLLPLEDCAEPVGLTALLEAMACGRPVIITPGRAARDHVVHGETGFVLHGDRSRWIAQIGAILAQPALLAQVGQRAREYVVARHSFAAVAPVWSETFEGGPSGNV